MAMPEILNLLNTDVQNRINSYRELAEKAVTITRYRLLDSDDEFTPPWATLKHFFYNLKFLLKEGYLPRMDDVKGERLPAELQGLKDFLNNPSREIGEAYYLQRNETEKYRFSWGNESKLIVTREVFYASPAGARSGYACAGGWRAQETTENVDAGLVLQALNGNQKTETSSEWTYKAFRKKYNMDNLHNPAEQKSSDVPAEPQAEVSSSAEGSLCYQKIEIRSDGYCFFRCHLIQKTNNDKWAQCSPQELRDKVLKCYYSNIFQAIINANKNLRSYGICFSEQALRTELENPKQLIVHTIADDGGYLWSPKGICARCEPQINTENLSQEDNENLEIFCDLVYQSLKQELNLNLDKDKGSYAIVNNGHYTWCKKLGDTSN